MATSFPRKVRAGRTVGGAAWHRHIERERKRLRQAHAVLSCLSETLAHSETTEGAQHADVVDVATDLLAAAIERLDLVVLRTVREPAASYCAQLPMLCLAEARA